MAVSKKLVSKYTPSIAKLESVKPLKKAIKKEMKPIKKRGYKVPKTPKVSGLGWGG